MRNLIIIAVALLSLSCNRYIQIERSEQFVNRENLNPKIICIDPQVQMMGVLQRNPSESQELEQWLKEELLYSARENGIDLEILDLSAGSSSSYYEDLLSLKKEFLQANNLQNTPLNFTDQPAFNSISKSVFVYPPLIAHDFTDLAKDYGTPYFSYVGVYKQAGRILYYHLIVNTNTAETVYRELKSIPRQKMKKKFISQLAFDSMAMLKEELE